MVKRAALLSIAVLVTWRCIPDGLDETGLLCSNTRTCSAGWQCIAGACVRDDDVKPIDGGVDAGHDGGTDAGGDAGIDGGLDGGVPIGVNLLFNPDFEEVNSDGGIRGWRGSAGLLTSSNLPFTGLHSARLNGDGGNLSLVTSNDPVRGTVQGQLYCARVFARTQRTSRPIVIALYIRDKDNMGGSTQSSNGTRATLPFDGSWVQVDESLSSLGLGRIDVRVATIDPLDGGETLLLDNAYLMRPDGGSCANP